MSLHDLMGLSGIPGLGTAVTESYRLYDAVQKIPFYRGQCRELSHRCILLLLAMRENSQGMEGSEMLKAADEVEAIIIRASKSAQSWASQSTLRSFVHQGDIKIALDKMYKDIENSMARFQIAGHFGVGRGLQDLKTIQERDQAENRETLQRIISNVDDMKAIMAMQPPAVQQVMQTLQEELQDEDSPASDSRVIQEGLWQIHNETRLLPPMTDLTGQVVKTSEFPVICGAYNDVYTGEWLGEEKVALRLARSLNHTAAARKRFHKEVEIWRTLQHPYILRLYGIVYFGDHVYSVSPWMENGDAVAYFTRHPQLDRLKILTEVASGLEYLHSNKVIHGDLRAANVLISTSGSACISDFGLSDVIEEVAGEVHTDQAASPVRWQAPELALEMGPATTATDVWSYGMVCVEIITGEKPYPHRRRDALVIHDITAGTLPDRPTGMAGMRTPDHLWNLMQRCWQREPVLRPSMTEVRSEMKTHYTRNAANDQPKNLPPAMSPSFSEPSRTARPRPQTSSLTQRTLPTTAPVNRPFTSPSTTPYFGRGDVPTRTRSNTSSTTGSAHSLSDGRGAATNPDSSQRQPNMLPSPSYPSSSSPRIQVTPPVAGLGLASPADTSNLNFFLTPSGHLPKTPSSRSTLPDTPPRRSTSSYAPSALSIALRENSIPEDDSPVSAPEFGQTMQSSPEFTSSSLPTTAGFRFSRETSASSRSEVESIYTIEGQQSPGSIDDLDPEDPCIVEFAKDGTVVRGTLRGLAKQLLLGSGNYAQDLKFRETFLSMYREFTTTSDLFRLLVQLFYQMDMGQSVQIRMNTRYLVVTVFKQWVGHYFVDPLDIALLEEMKAFASSITTPETIAKSAKDLARTIDIMIHQAENAQPDEPPLSPTRTIPKGHDIAPAGIAVGLTLLENDRYQAITTLDCISHLLRTHSPNKVTAARITNNTIINWVKKSILRSNRLDARRDVFKFFVNTAEECRKLNNFSSMAAVVAALESTTIARLRLTRSTPDKNIEQLLKRLAKYVDPVGNHQAYRSILIERNNGPCVPWLPIHLKDLTSIQRSMPRVIEKGGVSLINFERHARVLKAVDTVLSFKKGGPYNLETRRDSGPLAYLESELAKVRIDDATDNGFEERSLDLKKQEDMIFEDRLLELQAVGFGTKKPRTRV